MALISKLAQEKLTDKKVGKLLDDLRPYEESLPDDSDDASLIRVARRKYERAIKVLPKFIGELNEHQANSYQAWAEARPANDFNKVRDNLEKTLDLSRQLADFYSGYEHIDDPLIDDQDYGMKASSIRALFADLRDNLVPIVRAIASQPPADDSALRKHYHGSWVPAQRSLVPAQRSPTPTPSRGAKRAPPRLSPPLRFTQQVLRFTFASRSLPYGRGSPSGRGGGQAEA